MCYDFILQNVYFEYIDIIQMFGLKPYLTANAGEICPQLLPILDARCYKKSKDTDKMTPEIQALTKCLGRPVESVFPKNTPPKRYFNLSPYYS